MNLIDQVNSLAPMLAKLKCDPNARVFYELMSAALIWTDEKIDLIELSEEQVGYLRALFHYRMSLIDGEPDKRYEEVWLALKSKCPQWIGFAPDRCVLNEPMRAELNRRRMSREY